MSTLDIAIVVATLLGSVVVGLFFSGRQKSTAAYFLGGGKMPGWLVGVSLSAAYVSANTFLAAPGYSFQNDLRWVLPNFAFVVTGVFTLVWVIPFFRRATTDSGYAFLEKRFGAWARTYAAAGFLMFNMLRLGVVLYVTCLALEVFFGVPIVWLMLALGLAATLYTMAGGFEAVVWTEFFQAIILVAGAFLLLILALQQIPGGLQTVWVHGSPAGKFSLGSTSLTLTERTLWAALIAAAFTNASDYTTRQDFIQRYRAAKTTAQARIAVAITFLLVVPLWLNFNFLGTILWAFYDINPDPVVAKFALSAPEKIVPYFMSTQLSAGLKGVLLAAILTASLSTLAPILNACSVTLVTDFHRRFWRRTADEKHYLAAGRACTLVFGAIMVVLAALVHLTRSQAIQDLHFLFQTIFSAGLFALFMLGFFSRKIRVRAALAATAVTLSTVLLWVVCDTAAAQSALPFLEGRVPDLFWVPVFSNLLLPALALLFNRFTKDPPPAGTSPPDRDNNHEPPAQVH
ncbi:MAG: sodium/solute symporter [Opitutaceae bacterium]|jgi:SSS family solute:Na+ symporter|nr:sodium/solute symporter [Opitutaceae bacterium]